MIALYGCDVESIRRSDYSLYVALWLFRERSLIRKSTQVQHGIRAMLNPMFGKPMDDDWYRHVTETEDQAVVARDLQAPRG